MENKYDIFISYRREDTTDKAEHLCTLLEQKYEGRVSFDKENLQGTFDIELAKRIDACTDFILVVGKNSLNYKKPFIPEDVDLYNFLAKASIDEFEKKLLELGVNKKLDFFRIEIARALQQKGRGINIIVVAPFSDAGFDFSKLLLPPDIEQVLREEAVFYHIHKDAHFKDIRYKLYTKLKTNIEQIYNEHSSDEKKVLYKVRVNRACWLYLDDEKIQQLEANKITKISLPEGEYLRKVVTIDDESICDEKELILLGTSKLETIVLNCSDVDKKIESKKIEDNLENQHEFVDLGLSVKWATCNVGANKPEECGDYFAWGETETKEQYTWETYKYSKGSKYSLTKYCQKSKYGDNGFIDNKTILDADDDAARINWGKAWRMPTKAEQNELREKCEWVWRSQNGVKGYKVIGPNGNSIFLPASGVMKEKGLCLSDSGNIWSSEVLAYSPYNVYDIGFYSDDVIKNVSHRYCGQSIRPVCL